MKKKKKRVDGKKTDGLFFINIPYNKCLKMFEVIRMKGVGEHTTETGIKYNIQPIITGPDYPCCITEFTSLLDHRYFDSFTIRLLPTECMLIALSCLAKDKKGKKATFRMTLDKMFFFEREIRRILHRTFLPPKKRKEVMDGEKKETS